MRTCVQAYDICFGYRLYACTYERKNIKVFTVIAFEGGVDIMAAPQYAIMRFMKYKGPEIGRIEAHDERTKESYASNPDIDSSRTHLNFHLVEPKGRYRAEAERQIKETGCRTRTDSVRLVETMITASPEFFQNKSLKEIRAFFREALEFLEQKQNPNTIISAVVHMDEKTPHMHLSFVPLTEDGRLCAKEIIGNKKKLTKWQDAYWEHMVKRFPELERGLSASETGRDYIPPRVFKEMTRLNKQREKLEGLLSEVNAFNARAKAAEIGKVLDKYIPNVEKMSTQVRKYSKAFGSMKAENTALELANKTLTTELKESRQESVLKRMADLQLRRDFDAAVALLERIPPEVLEAYAHDDRNEKNKTKGRGADVRD